MIPKITDPMGQFWQQPNPEDILIDKTHAVMSEKDFNALLEYSASTPSGVYVGKMWKKTRAEDKWALVWYGTHEDPNLCSNNYREILIV